MEQRQRTCREQIRSAEQERIRHQKALERIVADEHVVTLIYLEDRDEPVDESFLLRDHAGHTGIKAHLHRCRHVEVAVTFNGETVHHHFGPGTTVTRVKTWAAERKYGMTPQEAGEHVLQIAGTKERPDPGTHLGTIASCPVCKIAFDLVPNERVNG